MLNIFAFHPRPNCAPQDGLFWKNERVTIKDSQNNTITIFVGYVGEPKAPFLLYCYGNMYDSVTAARHVFDTGLSKHFCVVIFDYPGYGPYATQENMMKESVFNRCVNPNRNQYIPIPTEERMYLAAEAVYSQLNPVETVIYGVSLGSAAACHLAVSQRRPAGLVLESALSSAIKVQLGFEIPIIDQFCNLELAETTHQHYDRPVLFMHNKNDQLIHCTHSEELCNALGKKAVCICMDNNEPLDAYCHNMQGTVPIFDKWVNMNLASLLTLRPVSMGASPTDDEFET